MSLRIKLLGPLLIEDENGAPSEIMKWSKGCALLAYLAVTGQPQSREVLADLLWEAASTAQSLQNLRQLLSRTRQWVPELVVTRKQVAYPPAAADFHTLSTALASADMEAMNDTLRLYEGELLSGFYLDDAPRFNEWLLLEREHLRQRVAAAYRQVCLAYAGQEAWPKGIEAARRWLMLDELDEPALRHLLQLLAASGQVEVALQQYETSRLRLWAELGVEPEPETVQLARRLTRLKAEIGSGIAWDVVVGVQPDRPEPGQLAEPGPLPVNTYLPHRRNNDFTGRKAALLRLAERLLPQPDDDYQQPRAVAISGMGGVGKTQLAVEFAYRYGRFFPGGVYWLSFADAGNVAGEVAATGGEQGMALYSEAEHLTLADRAGRVQRAWRESIPRLLILDNCEEEGLLAEWRPVTGGCRVLLTSRRANWSRDMQVEACPLLELEPDESVHLLQKLVPDLAGSEAQEIAAEVGHLPLALHLAGGFLRHYRQISPVRYLAQLREHGLLQHPSLRGRGLSYSPTGHELDVPRTFAVSLAKLDRADEIDETARQLLARAACFAPSEAIPQTLLEATVVKGGIGDESDIMELLLAEDGLARLIALGFLESVESGWVVVHRLVAAFTREFLGVDESAQSAVENVLLRTISADLKPVRHLGKLPLSTIHLQHVVDQSLAREEDVAFRLVTLFGAHLYEVGDFENAQRYLIQAEAAAEKAGHINAQAEAQIWLAKNQKDSEDTLGYAERAEQLLRSYDAADKATLALALSHKGWALYQMGEAEAALAAAEEGLNFSIAADSRQLMGNILNLMGVVSYYILGRHEAAVRYLEQGLAIFRESGNRHDQSSILNNMGESARMRGDFASARDLYREALDLIAGTGDVRLERLIRSNLCGALVGLGEFDAAVFELEKLTVEAAANYGILSEAYRFLAEARLGQGESELALAAARQALALGETTTNVLFDIGRAWRVLGQIAARLEQPVRVRKGDDRRYDAAACFAKSVAIFTESEAPRDRALSLRRWAEYEMAQGNEAVGKAMFQEE